MGCGRPLEREIKDHPHPLGAGSRHGVERSTFRSFWTQAGGGAHAEAPAPPYRGRSALVPGGRWLQRNWFEKGYLLWGQVALSGHPRVHSALAPLGPLCSEGGKATEGFCQLWAGAGSRGLLSWLRSVAWRGPRAF